MYVTWHVYGDMTRSYASKGGVKGKRGRRGSAAETAQVGKKKQGPCRTAWGSCYYYQVSSYKHTRCVLNVPCVCWMCSVHVRMSSVCARKTTLFTRARCVLNVLSHDVNVICTCVSLPKYMIYIIKQLSSHVQGVCWMCSLIMWFFSVRVFPCLII